MVEASLTAAILVAVYAAGQGLAWLNASPWWAGSLVCLVGGTLGSVITGIGYHWALYRALRYTGMLTSGWWWSPAKLHPHLTARARRQVLPWFYAGAASFVLVVVGALALGAAALGYHGGIAVG